MPLLVLLGLLLVAVVSYLGTARGAESTGRARRLTRSPFRGGGLAASPPPAPARMTEADMGNGWAPDPGNVTRLRW